VPWRELSVMSERRDFVTLFGPEAGQRRALCRRFGISPTTGYKVASRYRAEGEAGLADRSRRPLSSPGRTPASMEALVVAARRAYPAWGGRKLRRHLQDVGTPGVPSASTITEILRRHGLLDPRESAKRQAWQRFERAAPNELWQMDFKGHIPLGSGRCHPLTVLDDHSRFAVAIRACADERWATVQAALTGVFRCYGLPDAMLMDNGSPWGSDEPPGHTVLTVWLLELGIGVGHGRPYHPQTQGKDERFHRTLKAELIGRSAWRSLGDCQAGFDAWRDVYNHRRPHEALGLATPASRYRASRRGFAERLEPFDYGPGAAVRRVDRDGWASFRNRPVKLGKAFRDRVVAFRPADQDGAFDILFHQFPIGRLDLRAAPPATGA
jgi:transposase InsO family protein